MPLDALFSAVVSVSYTCPYCDAVIRIDRDAYMADKSVTREPLGEYDYASTTDDDRESADGIQFVCIGDPENGDDGCGRTFYLNFVAYENGVERDDGPSLESDPRFDFLR
jgi:hypothetical protein